MISIEIPNGYDNDAQLADALRNIANMVEGGYRCGLDDPTVFFLSGEATAYYQIRINGEIEDTIDTDDEDEARESAEASINSSSDDCICELVCFKDGIEISREVIERTEG